MRRLVAVAAVLLLAACSSGPAPAAAPAQTPSPSAPARPPSAPAPAGHHHHPAGPAPSGAPGGTLTVHAADELRDTLTRLVPSFEQGFPGVRVLVEYGAGDAHARHVLDGAPIDVFVTAGPAAAGLTGAGRVRGAPAVVARDPIVIAVPGTAGKRIRGVADLAGARVVLCAETTACGRTGRAALDAAAVDVRPAAVEPDPAAALARVRAGAADAALVRRSDLAAAGDGLRAVDFAQANRIADEYAALRITTGANTVAADAFVAFLGSSLARRVFADAGLAPA